ncbi:MAG TPA: serpin family protein [Solirubrobacteraceae bacterium]|nr:serpin family protein [Solirubrobacteraceae bacterium]
MVVRALTVIAAVMLLAGCASATRSTTGQQATKPPASVTVADPRAAPRVTPADRAALADGNARFAGRLLAQLARTHSTLALSPFSISDALAMTYAGARGSTAEQIATALDFGLPLPRLAAAFNAQAQSLAKANGPGATLEVANALFGQSGQTFRPAFLAILARDYGAAMHTVDFASPDAVAQINGWVSDHTAGNIPQLLTPGDVSALTRLVLADAVYLDAKWLSPFQPQNTHPDVFHAPGSTIKVPTMHQNGTFAYRSGDGYQALELPYQGGRLALDILLPSQGGLQPLLARIAASGPLPLLDGMAPEYVTVALPKFQLRTQFDLSGPLAALGMPLAFDPQRADLSGIAGAPGYLYIQHVIHEAYIDVDEAGTKAAAATGVVIGTTAVQLPPKIHFVADRPFIFVLRDKRTGAILFTGVTSHP